MFQLAFLIGFFSYILYFLGIFGFFYKPVLIFAAIVYFSAGFISFFPQIKNFLLSIKFPKSKIFFFFLGLIIIQILINFVGTLGPELAFDATWYHLTLPKIFLSAHKIFHIPGGLFYYSDMPNLGELLYAVSLSFGSEIIAKIVHFVFGILIIIAIFLFGKKYFNKNIAIISALVLSTNLVFNWESITAYTDLIRTLFEFLAFWAIFDFQMLKQNKYLYLSAILLGFAACVKVLSIVSLIIFIPLIFYIGQKNRFSIRSLIKHVLIFSIITTCIPIPWFIVSFLHTGNPVYPFFTVTYPIGTNINLLNPLNFLKDVWNLLTNSADPISPVYIGILPLVVIFYKKFSLKSKTLLIYCCFAIIAWYITPQTGGGRFFLPFLPVFSLLCGYIVENLPSKKLKKILIYFVVILSFISIGFRGIANIKYIPVITGKQSKADFLAKNLNFSFGDFYDTDGFFKKHIGQKDRVLLLGFHNIFYVDFPFTLDQNDKYNYIAVQGGSIPKNFKGWKKIYENKLTTVTLYAKN